MPKHKEAGVSPEMGRPQYLMDALCSDEDDRQWLGEQIGEEGPPHKQWQHNLVLERLEALIRKTEQSSGCTFEVQGGDPVILHKHDHTLELPLRIPEQSLQAYAVPELREQLLHGPDHEVAYTVVLLQGLEWLLAQDKAG